MSQVLGQGRPRVSAFEGPTTAYTVRQLVWFDRSGARVGVAGDKAVQDRFDVDAKGDLIAVERRGEDGTQLWLVDAGRGLTTRVDTGSGPVLAPVLSRDGLRLTYIAREQGRTAIIERPTRGGAGRVLFEYRGEGVVYLAGRSWDDKAVLVAVAERNGRTVQLVPTDGGKPLEVGGRWVSPSTGRMSPDGKWLAVASAQSASGQLQIYVSPLPATGEQWQISASGGEYPQWRGDGRELFFIAPDGSIMSASITPSPKFDFTVPRVLFKTGLTGDVSQRFVVTADGNRFLFNMLPEGDRAATTTSLQVVLNWTKMLAR